MRALLPALLAVGVLAGCSFDALTSRVSPYRIDIRQGNFVEQEMVAQLKKGMTRDQVRFVLGTPLVVDPFHPDRWDYVYLFRPGGGEAQQRVLSVFFDSDRLDRVEGDIRAGDPQGEAAAQRGARSRVVEIAPPPAKN